MFDLAGDVLSWLEGLPPVWAYLVLLVVAYGENVVPPIPGDMAVVFAGYLAGTGALHLGAVIGLSTVGGALGFMTMYVIGRRVGGAVFDPDRLRWLPKAQIRKARSWLERWGYGVVAANRFLSGARSVISLSVGMAEMEAGRTALWATVSSAVWTALIAWAGYAVGDNWEVVRGWLQTYGQVMVTLLVLVALVVVGRKLWRRRRG